MASKKTTTANWPGETDDEQTKVDTPVRRPTFDVEALRSKLRAQNSKELIDRIMPAIIAEIPPGSDMELTECTVWTLSSNKISGGTGAIAVGRRLDGNSVPGLPTRITLLRSGITRIQVMQPDNLRFDYIWITEGNGYWK